MDCQQFLYSVQTPLPMGYMSNDQMDPSDDFDQIIEIFNQGFDDLMFSDASILGNVLDSSIGLPLDTAGSSPSQALSLHGDALACEVEGDYEQNSTSSGIESTKPKRDRSKTLVSERRRRSGMKEKLYELRSLVPNITKMDKASIIGDAVVYVQSLQDQAKKLANEISFLESSSKEGQCVRVPTNNVHAAKQFEDCRNSQCEGKILSVVAHEVGEGRFYVKVECSKGDGVVSALYSAIESLQCFQLENSNLNSFNSDRFVLILSLNVIGSEEVMTASTMKLWVMGALLKEGFGFAKV